MTTLSTLARGNHVAVLPSSSSFGPPLRIEEVGYSTAECATAAKALDDAQRARAFREEAMVRAATELVEAEAALRTAEAGSP